MGAYLGGQGHLTSGTLRKTVPFSQQPLPMGPQGSARPHEPLLQSNLFQFNFKEVFECTILTLAY